MFRCGQQYMWALAPDTDAFYKLWIPARHTFRCARHMIRVCIHLWKQLLTPPHQLTYWSRAVMKGVCCFDSFSSSSPSSTTSGSTLALFRKPLDPSPPNLVLHPWLWPHPLTAGRVASFLKGGCVTALCLCCSAAPALCEEGVGLVGWVYRNWEPATETSDIKPLSQCTPANRHSCMVKQAPELWIAQHTVTYPQMISSGLGTGYYEYSCQDL